MRTSGENNVRGKEVGCYGVTRLRGDMSGKYREYRVKKIYEEGGFITQYGIGYTSASGSPLPSGSSKGPSAQPPPTADYFPKE